MAPSSRITRKWEIFPGRNKFYCNGFLMTTPHNGVFFLTLILLTATSGLFFAFDCPFLATKISAAIPAIGVCLFLFTLGSLLRTSFSDPGIIPRASYDEAKYIEKQIEVPNSYNSPTYRPPPRTKEILVRGQAVKLKYCYTCKIFRPPRASHCSLCDNCVDRFDHHCPWVGNCVGKRNYRFFYMFVMSLAFLIVYVFSCSITHVILLAKENEEFIEVVKKTPFSIITATICFISVWSVIGLAGFHTYLTACEQTTNEDIKGAFSAKEGQQTTNPYSRGNLILNCFHVLCGPITPSLIDRRGVVTDAYRIQMRRPQPVQYNVPAVPTLLPQQPIGVDLEGQMINGVAMNGNAGGIGIYRQRSYDNLQNNNGNNNSNNVTMLVNNNNNIDEMQMSTVNHQQLQQQQQYYNQKDDSAEDTTIIENIELIGNINNNNISNNNNNNNKNSGSCNNLFNTDDDTITSIINDNKKQLNSTTINGNNNNNNNMNTTLSTTITTGIEENVYSNIPTFKSSNIQQQNKYSKSDPNLHVYSNVATTTTTPPVTTTSSSTTNLIKSPIIKNNFHNNNNCNNTTTTSSSFISDELDLDDPVSVTFGGSKKTNFIYPKKLRQSISDNEGHLIKTHNNNYNNNNNLNSNKIAATSSSTKSSSSSSLSVLNNKTQNEPLNTSTNLIQNNSSIQNSNNAINSTPSTLAVTSSTPSATTSTPATNNSNISNNNNNSSAFISPSRMRLLHDTTMINTALDLDSLDGSSIGNNSQACLVKMHNI